MYFLVLVINALRTLIKELINKKLLEITTFNILIILKATLYTKIILILISYRTFTILINAYYFYLIKKYKSLNVVQSQKSNQKKFKRSIVKTTCLTIYLKNELKGNRLLFANQCRFGYIKKKQCGFLFKPYYWYKVSTNFVDN